MPREVFISYASEDEVVANQVRDALETAGIACWIAPRDILAGQSWASSIVGALEECRILLVLISNSANRSRQMAREVELADAKKRRILPVRLEDVVPQKDLEYFTSNRQWVDVFPFPVDQHSATLIQAVTTLRNADTTHPSAPTGTFKPLDHPVVPPKPWWTRMSRMHWIMAGMSVAVVVLAIALIYALRQPNSLYKSYVKDGDEYSDNSRWLSAIDSYDRALASSPPSSAQPHLYFLRCHAKLEATLYDDAIDDCEMAIRLDAADIPARIDIGLAHMRSNRLTDAVKHFEEALRAARNSGDMAGMTSADAWLSEVKGQQSGAVDTQPLTPPASDPKK